MFLQHIYIVKVVYMKFVAKTFRYGNSLAIVIPSTVKDAMNLSVGEYLQVDVERIKNE